MEPGACRSGVIDVGGGMRGIYATGVFDRCLDDGVSFDVAIGISAGSANICSYLSRQRGRNIEFYANYSFRPEYMGLRNFLENGSYIDMDYVLRRAVERRRGVPLSTTTRSRLAPPTGG